MNTNKKSPIKIGIVCAGDKELAPFLPVNKKSPIKIGIVCAGDKELAPFLPVIDN